MKILLNIMIVGFMGISLHSCTEKIPPKLSKKQLAEIDSIVRSEQDSIWKMYDAECEKVFLDYYDAAVDSIKQRRLEEIESINAQ